VIKSSTFERYQHKIKNPVVFPLHWEFKPNIGILSALSFSKIKNLGEMARIHITNINPMDHPVPLGMTYNKL